MDQDRYSPDLQRRYQSSKKESGQLLNSHWPLGCFGSGNAFLSLIGPSMGVPLPDGTAHPGGQNRPEGSQMQIGFYAHFTWPRGRSDRWRRLASALLGGEEYVSHMTAVLNLDWSHQPDERKVPTEHLRFGFDNYVWPTLQTVRPRIVCALTNNVWDVMTSTIKPLPFTNCPVQLPRKPVVFRLPGAGFDSMVIKSHNHPSRPFLGRPQIAILGEAAAWFLSQSWEASGPSK